MAEWQPSGADHITNLQDVGLGSILPDASPPGDSRGLAGVALPGATVHADGAYVGQAGGHRFCHRDDGYVLVLKKTV